MLAVVSVKAVGGSGTVGRIVRLNVKLSSDKAEGDASATIVQV